MLSLLAALLVLAQAPSPADAAEPAREPLFHIWQGLENPWAPLPIVDLNRSRQTGENIDFLNEAGLPTIEAYHTPIVRYYEHSPYLSNNPTKHLLVQLALAGDAKRLQVLVVEAVRRDRLWWEITRSQVGYGSPKLFDKAAPSIIEAAGRLPHFAGSRIIMCSHPPGAQINVRIRAEIDLERGGICQRTKDGPAVAAGGLVISVAEKVLGEKIERAADFGD